MANMHIASTISDEFEPLGNPGQRSFDLLRGVLLDNLSERHANLLAEPVTSSDGRRTDWYSDGAATMLADLAETDQVAAKAELGRIMTDIEDLARRVGARGGSDNQRLSAALRNTLEIPDEACIYIRHVDSSDEGPFQPILVNWSHRRTDQSKAVSVLSTMVPRQPRAVAPEPTLVVRPAPAPVVRSEFPWWIIWWLGWLVLGVATAYLLWLLVLPCGVRLPFGGTLHHCPAAVAEVDGAAARQAQLESEVARLELELAILEGQCRAQTVAAASPEDIEQPSGEIDRRLERENAQQGELSFTLVWNNRSDIDLHVTCPNNSKIFYDNRSQDNSSCTGELDVDANINTRSATSEPVENVFFSRAESGRYLVEVKLFEPRVTNVHDFTLRIQDGGSIKEIQGSVRRQHEVWRHTHERN